MSNRPEGDDQEARRLSDYSDAILRGETPDARDIDPEDAELIRKLHQAGRSVKPDPQLERIFWRTLDEITGSASQSELPHQPRGPAPTIPFPPPTPSTPQVGETPPLLGKALEQAQAAAVPPVVPLPPEGSRSWGRSAAAIAAALLLFLAVAASLVFFATNRGDDETPTLPVAGQGTTQPTTQANVVASPTTSDAGSPTSTPTIPALINDIEGILVYQKFVEPSSVGKQTPAMELFRQRTSPFLGTARA
jgi:hypothetical protein